jgi:hypothetical protein
MFNKWAPSKANPGVAERWLEDDGRIVRQKYQDAQPILDRLQKVRSETDGRTPEGGQYIGSIPMTLYYEWLREWTAQGKIAPGHMTDLNDLLVAKLRDGDFAKLRATNRGI